jgi:hypothetical protein
MNAIRRAPCPRCDKGERDDALEIGADGARYCFRCAWRAKPCSACGTLFEPRGSSHDRCDACYRAKKRQVANLRQGDESPVVTNGAQRDDDHGRAVEQAAAIVGIGRNTVQRVESPLTAIWARTLPLAGTIGETYIRHRRGVLPPADSDVRYLPPSDRYPPSLCALVTDAVTAEPISLHFTRLAADGRGKAGTERDKVLLAGHRKAGGVIRIWPDEAVTHGLAIAEGIETALSAAHAYTPVWATVDAGNLAAFLVLGGISSLIVFADHDPAGLDAARKVARRWHDAGREVRVTRPKILGTDVNDAINNIVYLDRYAQARGR